MNLYAWPLGRVTATILLLVAVWTCITCAAARHTKHKTLWRRTNRLLLLLSISAILYLTLWARTPSAVQTPVLRPLHSLAAAKEQPELYREMLMNLFLFVPLGLSMPVALPGKTRYRSGLTILTALAISCLVEYTQYRFGLGLAETDDVIMNTLGAAIGSSAQIISQIAAGRRRRNAMDQTTEIFLALLAYELNEKPLPSLNSDPIDWQKLLAVSNQQNVTGLIYDALGKTDAFVDDGDFQQTKMRFKKNGLTVAAAQLRRTVHFQNTYQLLKPYQPIIVKGLICRSCYPSPDLRPSGDEDLLVSRDNYKAVEEILLKRGFLPDKEFHEGEIPEEMGFHHPATGEYYEIHTSLFDRASAAYHPYNRIFEHVEPVEVTLEEGTFYTMEPTRHLFFLLVHMLKHFINGGVGIRQLCDIMMFVQKYGADQIDWNRMDAWLKAFRLETYWMNLAAIGEDYLGFSELPLRYPVETDPDDMIADMIDGGVFGHNTTERTHSANITISAVEGGTAAQNLSRAIFPSYRYMAGKYPFVRDKKWLLPAAYCMRIAGYFKERTGKHDGDSAAAMGRKRVKLLKKYGIVR